jgi:CDP-diacylglycerol--serine O-phosphatidyltransferase
MASQWETAVGFVVVAAFIDGMDGRLARLLNASSAFGAQLDSLSDFVNFGVVPALIIYMWSVHEVRAFGWAVSLFFIICMALRLARFNSTIEDDCIEDEKADSTDKELQEHFFIGIPAPAGAGLLLLPMMLMFLSGQKNFITLPTITPQLMVLFTGVMALLLVSRFPTFSFKKVRIRREFGTLVLAIAALITIALLLEPWITLPLLGVGYIILMPCSLIAYYQMKRRIHS